MIFSTENLLSADERKMTMKKQRHDAILRLISSECISTQGELLDKLNAEGFNATQATVSRDIRDLRIIKKPDDYGRVCYAVDKESGSEIIGKYKSVFMHSVVSADYAGNIVAVKCYTGMASAACAALDSMNIENVLGTLAGDDTIFMLCRNQEAAAKVKEMIENVIA